MGRDVIQIPGSYRTLHRNMIIFGPIIQSAALTKNLQSLSREIPDDKLKAPFCDRLRNVPTE